MEYQTSKEIKTYAEPFNQMYKKESFLYTKAWLYIKIAIMYTIGLLTGLLINY